MLSFVVPAYNETESVSALLDEIERAVRPLETEWELIFIDDGSTDSTWDQIAKLSSAHAHVSGIRFRRNFGKAAALSAGFSAARGDIIFTLDADLQDDPQEIPNFLAELDRGFDCVSGWKQVRHDPWHKTMPSKVFNGLVGYLTGVKLHDHNCGFKCYRREIFSEVRLYGELHRFVPVLAAARGWKVSEIPVHHRARKFGVSKYGFRRFIKGFLDLLTVYFLTGFAQRPQHLLGTWGFASFGCGLVGMFYFAVYWVIRQFENRPEWLMRLTSEPLHHRPALLYSVAAMLLGAQLLAIGFLAELLTAYQGSDAPTYSVKDRCGRLRNDEA